MNLARISIPAVFTLLVACSGPRTADSEPEPSGDALFGPEGGIGDACVVPGDCISGRCDRTVPGGYCTAACGSGVACPSGAVCVDGLCFAGCEVQAHCRSNEFRCYEAAPEVGVCSFGVAAATPEAPNVGAPCRASVECAAPGALEAYCIPERDTAGASTGFDGGMCVALGCTADADCGEGARCISGSVPYCVPGCSASVPCRSGYACDEVEAACRP